jgi:heme-degrading monooxygenase HmoA
MTWGYLIIWEFCSKAGSERRFEEVYGSNGIWARFFQQDQEFIGTELIRDFTVARRYLTLDFWTSREAYEQFRRRHANQYQVLDQECDALIEQEREVGRFERLRS